LLKLLKLLKKLIVNVQVTVNEHVDDDDVGLDWTGLDWERIGTVA